MAGLDMVTRTRYPRAYSSRKEGLRVSKTVLLAMCITVSASQRGTAQVNLVEKLGVHAPIAKYNAQNAAPSSSAGDESVHPAKSTEDARHIRRDTYYDRLRPGPIRDPGNSGLQAMEWPGFTHWDVRLPAIPAPQSAVIVVGQLAAA